MLRILKWSFFPHISKLYAASKGSHSKFLMMVIAAFCWLFCSHYSSKSWQLTSKKLNSCHSLHWAPSTHCPNCTWAIQTWKITLNSAVLAAILINKELKDPERKWDLTTSAVNDICMEGSTEDPRKDKGKSLRAAEWVLMTARMRAPQTDQSSWADATILPLICSFCFGQVHHDRKH